MHAVRRERFVLIATVLVELPVHVLGVADRAPGERRPLFVFLHGLGGCGAEELADPGIRALAERGRMVVVAPDGDVDRQGRRFWNAGGACCNFNRKPVDDIGRLEALTRAPQSAGTSGDDAETPVN